MASLRKMERVIVRSMCGVKLVDRKNNEGRMEMLSLKKTLVLMAKVNGIRWYGCLWGDDNFPKRALMLRVNGQRKKLRLK